MYIDAIAVEVDLAVDLRSRVRYPLGHSLTLHPSNQQRILPLAC